MAKIDLENISKPLSEEQPCGPDLDMEFDMDFMNLVAELDGSIPTRYFGWDPATLNFQDFYDRIGEFLQRTRDIRLLVPLAKLRILQSDLGGFAETLEALNRLLRERWSDLHPQPVDFLDLSMGQLATLDDMPNVVLPLQHAPVVRSRRAGAITLRKWQVAHGQVNPREGEETADSATLSSALAEADADELARARDTLARARDAVAGIRTVCIQEAGYDKAPPFERLPAAIEAAVAMIETATGIGAGTGAAPEAADGETSAAAAGPAGSVVVRLPQGAVANREEAVEAMHVAARYFALKEPSSPVPILLREAQAASAKSFYELVNDLVPDYAGQAFISLGRDTWFDVYLSTIDARNPPPDYAVEEEDVAAETAGLGDDELAEQADDGSGEEADVGEVPADPEAGDPPADASADAAEGAAGDGPAEQVEPEPEVLPEPGPAGAKFVATSRPEAVALLEKVLAYYRAAEPSSPVPLLVERAVELSSKSFIELLSKVLPEGSLRLRDQ